MSVLNRISTILRANINDLLDRAEDPEKMLNQILRDMAEVARDARKQVAEAMAQAKLQEGDLRQARELSVQWQHKAELAISKGADDLARECLRRKRDYDANAQIYEQQVVAVRQSVAKMKDELSLLESRYAEIQRDRELLLARYKVARGQQQIQKGIEVMSIDPAGQLARVDQRIRVTEASVAAAGELAANTPEAQLKRLAREDADIEIEAELLRLKSGHKHPELPGGHAEETK
ncbi:PspA/IM30 family protein [Nitrolancea hollandica]|uniref:Phage shock protein A, PspA n=1 Tax=Nitrolancea hollandica Lb TaxID=1129897 RepID=I4EIX5_9BACT|nr:PspA/IM30 family protein [Nitrolancea hollandica]CCF84637.1 Phage shock protein A, PspA [Nitrolancea hollandica Lb]